MAAPIMRVRGQGRPNVFFSDRGDASYIRSDMRLLSDFAEIRRTSFLARGWHALPMAFLRQMLVCLRSMPGSDVVFVHFAGWNALLPLMFARLFRKPSVLFLHGTDAASMPELGYGQFRKWPLSWATAASLRMAGRIVVVDEALLRSTNTWSGSRVVEQGIRAFVPSLKTPADVLPHGFDPDEWPMGDSERDIDVLTVGVGLGTPRIRRLKGVDLLIEAARRVPGLKVAIVGLPDHAIPDLPDNIIVIPEVKADVLRTWYQRSRCYTQLSRSESFGCALCEAMLSGCIPVVSRVGAMPRIVGDTGAIVGSPVLDELQRALEHVLGQANGLSAYQARERVRTRYSLDARRGGLMALLSEMLPS